LPDATLPDVATLSFEAALKQLEEIVTKLERGDVPLEESIAIYERGESPKARRPAPSPSTRNRRAAALLG
jgi:exodeoxyribonuclease VII small subunit